MKHGAVLLAAWLIPSAFGQPPALQNAHVETRPASGGLDGAMQAILTAQAGPAWAGYAIPAAAGQHSMCCSDSWQCCSGCSLEGRTAGTSPAAAPVASKEPIYLEGPKQFLILYRMDRNQIDRLRVFSPDCAIDAGGLPVFWLTDVKPAESIGYLRGMLSRDGDWRGDNAVTAIALHAAPEAIATLTEMAHNGRTSHQRTQALVWLARTAPRAVSEPLIEEAIAKDPSTEIKRQAVFALSQIPHNDGVPRMIQLARSSPDQTVRKQAMFWLGRVKDDRAYRFFEEVLTH